MTKYCIDLCTSICDMKSGLFYVKPSSHSVAALTTDWYSEYVPDHFQNLNNSSVVRNHKIHKKIYTTLSYSANKHWSKQHPC